MSFSLFFKQDKKDDNIVSVHVSAVETHVKHMI